MTIKTYLADGAVEVIEALRGQGLTGIGDAVFGRAAVVVGIAFGVVGDTDRISADLIGGAIDITQTGGVLADSLDAFTAGTAILIDKTFGCDALSLVADLPLGTFLIGEAFTGEDTKLLKALKVLRAVVVAFALPIHGDAHIVETDSAVVTVIVEDAFRRQDLALIINADCICRAVQIADAFGDFLTLKVYAFSTGAVAVISALDQAAHIFHTDRDALAGLRAVRIDLAFYRRDAHAFIGADLIGGAIGVAFALAGRLAESIGADLVVRAVFGVLAFQRAGPLHTDLRLRAVVVEFADVDDFGLTTLVDAFGSRRTIVVVLTAAGIGAESADALSSVGTVTILIAAIHKRGASTTG